MKTSYEARAYKFAQILAVLFSGCVTLADFEWAIKFYNAHHSRPIKYDHGVSRIVVIRADYVIKCDFRPEGRWADGSAGNIDSEVAVYKRAVADGMSHLLAKPTVVKINDRKFSIMPKIDHVGSYYRHYDESLTFEEEHWLYQNVCDLHAGNMGYKNGKPVIIDYAWDGMTEEPEISEESEISEEPEVRCVLDSSDTANFSGWA